MDAVVVIEVVVVSSAYVEAVLLRLSLLHPFMWRLLLLGIDFVAAGS